MSARDGRLSLFVPPRRRRTILCVLAGVVVGVAGWFFGMDVAHAIGLGAVVAALALGLALVGDQPRVDWAPAAIEPRDGARRDVVQLGWALHSRRRGVAPEAVRRLRTVTAQALELHGLELENDAHRREIERVLGATALRAIRRGAESPTPALYESAVRALERIAAAPAGPLASAPDAPTPDAPTPDAPARAAVAPLNDPPEKEPSDAR
ncbi:hypothetical protein ACFVWR_05085 [Leifsonia sp. NPDC058292]|uniref:hypothetical protein n=1 Tax=Leifsonia sp. NPDC058292 TaxID=3346428 RepID=UPI0036D9FCE9